MICSRIRSQVPEQLRGDPLPGSGAAAAARIAGDLQPGQQDPQRVPFPAARARKQAIRAAGRVNGQGNGHRRPEQAESGQLQGAFFRRSARTAAGIRWLMICSRIRSGCRSSCGVILCRSNCSSQGGSWIHQLMICIRIREQLQGNPLPEIRAGSGSSCSGHRQRDPLPEISQGGSRDPLADDLHQDPQQQPGQQDPQQKQK